ncbi:AAA family ATPase [Salegentibacter sp. BDJ18]|uniref:AAA family ATPase n=1 Tax=Salegentibacter sp. BDJ18 TaxID=2816376 RepID=UPI001AAE4B74|nr:AAA family ATPase [Salegentibacter sp. BDJ18]MBO2546027.1 AAA family ATPase [Salegentibacter sp. BDJ18]
MNYKKNKEPKFLPGFNLSSLFDKWGDLDIDTLFIGYFGKVPSRYSYKEVNMEEFHLDFPKRFQDYILGYHFKKVSKNSDFKNDFVYVLDQEILVIQDSDEIYILFQNETCELLSEIIDFTKKLIIEEKNKPSINLIISQPRGLDNKKINFEKPEIDLYKMYNDDFETFHNQIIQILREENKSGLHLLYGKPGTGKSTYIRYLCGLLKKEIVFLPGQMAQNLDNVAMIRYLMGNANSILVIEDAEELIVSREGQRNSNLSMILNITDGILGESLGIQIIATFNTDVRNIDPALKRKGRLKSAYEFKALPGKSYYID